MGAALGAAGDVQREGTFEQAGMLPRNLLGYCAGLDIARRTGRLTGAGGDEKARIGGVGDETDALDADSDGIGDACDDCPA